MAASVIGQLVGGSPHGPGTLLIGVVMLVGILGLLVNLFPSFAARGRGPDPNVWEEPSALYTGLVVGVLVIIALRGGQLS
jgi:hypothetical protein